MKKLLTCMIFIIATLFVLQFASLNVSAGKIYDEGEKSLVNNKAREYLGRENCWMNAFYDNEYLSLGYGGNNYDEENSLGSKFQIIENSDGSTYTIKCYDRILVGNTSDLSVKMLPESTSMNLPGAKWKFNWNDNEMYDISCGTPSYYLVYDEVNDMLKLSQTIDGNYWDAFNVDSNITFEDPFLLKSFTFWNKSLGDASWPGISVTVPQNGSDYNINKRLNSFDYKDYVLQGKVRPTSGTAGLIFRNDGTNMYLWSLDRTNKRAELFKINIASGLKTKLKSTSVSALSADVSYLEKIILQGNKMLLYINDVYVDSFEDSTSTSGLIGYWVGGSSTSQGSAVFSDITVRKDVPSIWYRSVKSFTGMDNITDLNNVDISQLNLQGEWTPWVSNFGTGSNDIERFFFQTTVNVPENVSDLVISSESGSTITVDDKFSVFVNGRRVAADIVSGVQSIKIDRKFLMPGRKNDILIILYDLKRTDVGLNKLKITPTLDTSYEGKKIIEQNGFKIQYDETNPTNSKIIKFPENTMIDGLQTISANASFDEYGEVKYAYFSAKVTGDVYRYNGWNKYQKIFSPNANSTIDIEISNNGARNYSTAQFKNVKFEIADLDIFSIANYITSINASVNIDESISLRPTADFNILGEKNSCELGFNISGNNINVSAGTRININKYVKVTKRLDTGYEEEQDLQITGGFKYDIFKGTLSNYNIEITPYDSGKVRVTIPRFAELSFGKMTIDSSNINVTDLGLLFSKDCVIEGLRPVNTPSLVTNLKSLSINKKASSLADIISACELSVTCNNTVNIFGGIELGAGTVISCFVDSDPVTKLPKRFGFKFGGTNDTDGKILFPSDDNKKIEIPLTLKIDSAGNFDASSELAFTSPIIFKGINLSTAATSKIKIRLVSDSSIRKFMFDFTNVGTTISIPNAGDVIFNITKFDFSDKNGGTVENIEGQIKTNISFFSGNMLVTTGTKGKIKLAYNATTKWTIAANDVKVDFPKVGTPPLSAVTSFEITSNQGLKDLSFISQNEMKFMNDFVVVNGFDVNVIKEGSAYALTLSTPKVVCDIQKIFKLNSETKAYGENLVVKVGDLSKPLDTTTFSCGPITYEGTIEFDLGLKFKTQGITVNLNAGTISLANTTFLIPQIPGIKYFKDEDFKIPEDSNKTEFSITQMTVGYKNDKWSFSINGFEMPGGCEYNLFNLNVVKVGMAGLSLKSENDNFVIGIAKANATTASGYKAEVGNVKISNSDVSIGYGSVTIPELSLGGIGINNLMATFGTETIGGKDYPFFGGACSVTLPGLNSIDGSLKIQLKDDNFFGIIKEASFELTFGVATPLGNTGIGLKMIRGSLTKGDFPKNFPEEFKFMFGQVSELKIVSMGLQLVDMSTNGFNIKGGADVWVELTNWGYAMDLNASIYEGYIQAQAGVAYANEIFAARAKVRVACLEGKVIFYVYKYDGSTAISGEGSVAVRLDAGKILNKRIWRWKIRIPRNDVWFDGLGAKFGRFTNGKVGFQARVSFPVLGSMNAFIGDGGLKFFSNYSIYVPQPKTTAQAAGSLTSYAAVPMIPVVKATTYSLDKTATTVNMAAASTNLTSSIVAAATPISDEPVSETIMENGVYKGIKMTFTNKDDLERIVVSASTDKIIPNISVKLNGATLPLDGSNISTDIREVEEVDDNENPTGKIGISYLLGIEKPVKDGTYVIEVRCDETVDVSLLTKLSDPVLKINSSVYNASNSTLTVSGNITSYTGNENVTLLLKNVPKVDTDSVVPGERVVAVSKALSDMDGIKLISLTGGSFTVVIDTTIFKTGTYSLVAELERKVTGTYEGGELKVEQGEENLEYNVSDRQEYMENNAIKKYDIVNSNLKKVTGLKASVTAYGSSPNYRYNLDVSFKNTRVADGYMLFADCEVDGVPVGTRKINLGNMSKTRIGQFTEYLSVTNGVESYKPIKMMVYIVPYKYIDPSKGFIYDFGNTLGYSTVANNITTVSGTESDKVEVWIKRSTSSVVTSCSTDFGTAASIPVEGSAKGKLTVNANGTGKVLVMVKDVTKRTVELGTGKEDSKKKIPTSILGEAVSVVIGNDKMEAGDVCELVSGANNIDLTIIANVSAAEAKAINDSNAPISVTLSVFNAENPDNYKEITIPCKFRIDPLTLKNVNQEKFSAVTGGILDVYGTELVKGTKVKLGTTELGTTELEVIPEYSGKSRISAKIPQGFTAGEYDLVVEGPAIPGVTNSKTWTNKISIINSIYEYVKVRDTGKVKRGTSSKFYFRLESTTGYKGKAGIRTKTVPAGWTVVFNKNVVAMDELVEATVTVPSTETAGDNTIEIEACRMADNDTATLYSKLSDIKVTVTTTDMPAAVSSLSSIRVNAGDTIKIYGEGFISTSIPELVTKKGTKTLQVVERTGNMISAVVPTDAISGDIRINTNGVYSSPVVPLVVVPTGVVANFEKAPLSIILAPGETGFVTVPNNGKPVTMTSDYNINTSWNTTEGKVQVTIPNTTVPGEYMACANIKYQNTVVDQRIVVYVVNNGKSLEDLTRQMILTGRNLKIKARGASVTSLEIAKLELDGTALVKTPVKVTDGWDIDVGVVNHGSVVKYQFRYVVSGTTYTTSVYEYKVQLADQNNNDDIYTAALVETIDGSFKLAVTPKSGFNPASITAKIYDGPTVIKSELMTKDGTNWSMSLDNIPNGKSIAYTLTFKAASNLSDITTAQKPLTNTTISPPEGSSITYSLTRGTDGNVSVVITKFQLGSTTVTPTWVRAEVDTGTGTTPKLNLTYDGSKFTGNIGNINNATKFNISFTYDINNVRYGYLLKGVTYYDSPNSVNGFVGEFFDNKYFSDIKLKTVVPQIDYDFVNKAPMGGILQNTTYSMRWSGKLQARYGEEYTFYLTVPNGKATIWVDGKTLADGKGALSGKATLTAGKPTDIIVEYATDGNGAIKLEWQSSRQVREVVPKERVIAVTVQKPGATDFVPFTTQVAYDMIAIGWNAPNVTGVSYYEVYEGTNLISTLWGIKNFTRTGLVSDRDYSYQIKAYNSAKTLLATSSSIVIRTERAPMDLALNKPVTASSTFDTLNATKFAVDGDSNTKWTSNHGDNQWIRVDLGREYEIVKVRLNWREDYHAKNYSIQVSNDDAVWRDVYSTITGDGGTDEIRLSSVKARYVRMKATLRGINSNPYALWDFNVYGYGYSSIKTMFYNQVIDAQNNNITPTFKIINTGTENVNLNTLKLRYYYTVDKDVPQKFTCDWTPISPHVTGTFVKMGSPKDKADYYLEVGFQTTTPILKPGENVEVKARFNREEWTLYTQTNDYSFDGVSKDYVDSNRITVYESGNLIQGVEPVTQLSNMSFDSNASGWTCYASSTAGASVEWSRDTVNYDTAPAGYAVKCITKGTREDSIQVFTGASLEKGKYYNLTFRAKASSAFTIPQIALIKNVSPYTFYAVAKNAQVTTGWKTYSYTFKINTTEPNARINFLIGNAIPNGATWYLDTLSFTEVSAPAELVANTSLTYDAANWTVWSATTSGAVATGSRDTVNFDTQPAGYKVNCVTKGTSTSQIQLMLNSINIEDGKTYNLTFRAKASAAFTIPYFKIIKNGTPYTNYSSTLNNIAITTAWKNYHYVFTATGSDPAARLNFEMGNALPDGAEFYIDTVSFKEAVVNEITESMSNPSFNDNTSDWVIYYDTNKGASGTISRDTVNYDTQPAGLKVHCATKGTEIGAMHVNAMGVKIEAGKTYKLTFRAKATVAFNIPRMVLIRRTAPNNAYTVVNPINSSNIAVTTAWQTYTYTFTANVTDPDSRLLLYLGNAIPDNSDLFMDSFSIKEV